MRHLFQGVEGGFSGICVNGLHLSGFILSFQRSVPIVVGDGIKGQGSQRSGIAQLVQMDKLLLLFVKGCGAVEGDARGEGGVQLPLLT